MKDFILGKKVEYPNLELLKNYFLTIPSYNHFKNKSIIFINDNQKKVQMKIHKETGDVIDIKLNVRLDVPEEVVFWKNGGILPTAYKEA